MYPVRGARSLRAFDAAGARMKKFLKILGALVVVLLLIGGYAGYRIARGHPFTINQLANRQAVYFLEGLPLIRQQPIYSAFTEGWALYAERLAVEIGLYADDPYGDLGRLQAEMYRAVRLVMDTGIHAKGWSREQSVQYMAGATGLGAEEVASEVERYMALPGQATACKVGQLKILELRERAREALGDRFDLKDFHAVVLENGAVPLTVLERLVDERIAARRA